ncbi:hypothetical protein RFN57_25685 [Streptomyces violaceochromogenes]|uniref:Uncharacterized protein n=1 Tax=Streptomyces violaceochromogenes TaxID=67377 RepID=A0ABU6M5E7_9ACTN|nr:hypothetical protein [Streptomyces violaceochromogenes]MEC7055646.1 hypothetical protein [Streptomyces violaceochromogenes]
MEHVNHPYSRGDFEERCPRCCLDVLNQRSWEAKDLGLAWGLEGLVEEHPRVVEQHLLHLAADSRMFACDPPSISRDFVGWAAHLRRPDRFAEKLPVPTAVLVGLARARDELSRFDRDARNVLEKFRLLANGVQSDLWYHVALLTAERTSVATAGLRAQVGEMARHRPRAWAVSLDWLFAVGTQLHDLDVVVTLTLAQTRSSVRGALKRSMRSDVPTVRRRAAGVTALADGSSPIEEKLLDALSQSVDARRQVFPRPLEHPSSTWLSSFELEDLIRGGVSAAVRDFAAFVAQSGSQDEEPLTASLLRMLEKHLSTASTAGRRLAPGAPEVVLASRQETKHAERGNGADVGIVLDAAAPGRMTARIGDLVQVKKADALIPSAPHRDAWKIDRVQLTTLLDQSATATYWLIPGSGEVRVVPAKFLAAIGAAKGGSTGLFTVGHTEVRNSAIGLEHYLTDLITGLWLGSSGTALTAASGSDPRNRPTFFLRINVTLPLLDDQYRGGPFIG